MRKFTHVFWGHSFVEDIVFVIAIGHDVHVSHVVLEDMVSGLATYETVSWVRERRAQEIPYYRE
jgi:hypothetical protein